MYFNGHLMPRWANCWHLVLSLERIEDLMKAWDAEVEFTRFWRLHCRIDHVGIAESEDPHVFRACCLALMYVMLRHEGAILDDMKAAENSPDAPPSEIFNGVLNGLFQMYHRCHQDGIAFWTSGYEADQVELLGSIGRHRLPQEHPDWLEAPHISKSRWETTNRIRFLRRDIVALLGTRPIPKEIRRAIHELPKEVSN
jgi:hypothetical protein